MIHRLATDLRRSVLICLWLLASSAALAQIPANGIVAGSLVIAGGALRSDTADVWQRIVNLAGGPGARIVVLPTASDQPEASARSTAEILARYGAQPVVIPLAPRWLQTDFRKVAADPAMVALIDGATGVFFTGGDQCRITQALLDDRQGNTPVLDAIWALYRRGGVVAGSSAGAAVMSQWMFCEPPDVLAVLQSGVREGRVMARGLGFLGPDVFVDQHLLVRGRFARMLPAMLDKRVTQGFGIDEDTAIVVAQQKQVEVLGNSAVIYIDLARATRDQRIPHFNVKNARLNYLQQGDRVVIAERTVMPLASRMARPAQLEASETGTGVPFFPDMLGLNMLTQVMTGFARNDQRRTTGLAFGPQGGSGFEFQFRREPDTASFVLDSKVRSTYSILNLYLDVTPVQFAQPLYRPRD